MRDTGHLVALVLVAVAKLRIGANGFQERPVVHHPLPPLPALSIFGKGPSSKIIYGWCAL